MRAEDGIETRRPACICGEGVCLYFAISVTKYTQNCAERNNNILRGVAICTSTLEQEILSGETLLLAIFFRSGYPTASLQLNCLEKPAKHVYTRQDGMFLTPIAIAIDQSKLTKPQVFILGVNFPERNLVKASPHHHTPRHHPY